MESTYHNNALKNTITPRNQNRQMNFSGFGLTFEKLILAINLVDSGAVMRRRRRHWCQGYQPIEDD
jgi:hypothetical protein